MLHKCANPACSSLFRSLSRGKLFLVDIDRSAAVAPRSAPAIRARRSAHRVERYWLCDGCCSHITLTFERDRGLVTVPLPVRDTSAPALHLSQMLSTVPVYRAKGAL